MRKTTKSKRMVGRDTPKQLVLFNKPYDVLTQFSDDSGRKTLKDYIPIPHIYAAGRLDRDSEGLLVLTNDGILQNRITSPNNKMSKTYWVQVDGQITSDALTKLSNGVKLKDGLTRPAKAEIIMEPSLWQRVPPVRFRANIPTSWISLTLTEGKNRQVRRMTAAVGFPTLRLIRYRIGNWTIDGIANGEYQLISANST